MRAKTATRLVTSRAGISNRFKAFSMQPKKLDRRSSSASTARFVQDTDADLLAVSVGNVHIMIKGQQDLDLERLSEINRQVAKPLVLHGGTGITASSLRAAIDLGVAKVNYGTYLKQRYLQAVRTSLAANVDNPHELLGMGGARDVMVAGRSAVS